MKFFFLISLTSLFFLCFELKSEVVEVCPTCAHTSIKKAIGSAKNGDVIRVKKGHYKESNIVIDKAITLTGVDFPVIDAKNSQEEIFIVTADSVTIEGFQIQNIAPSYLKDLSGIRIRRKKNFVIRNNRLYNTMFAIYLEYSNQGIVSNNRIIGGAVEESSSGNGIHAWYCNKLTIENNFVSNQRDGIYFEFVTESSITNNTCENNLRYGLHFMFSNYDTYRGNVFRANGAGVAVMFSKEIKMYRNRFVNNWGGASYGLLLKEIYDADIRYNVFDRNTVGIRVEGSTRVKYSSNDFINNGWAIKFAGGCYDNAIHSNNFIANSFDLAMDKASNNNSLEKNYWADYSGYDLDKDGTGDVPHRPVKLFNFIVLQTPESVILLRSLFIDLINFSEKVSPVFTPKNVVDDSPKMKRIIHET